MWHVWERGEVGKWFWCGNMIERDYLEDLDVDGRIILKWALKKLHRGAEWSDMVQDRNKWRAFVNKEMKFRGTLTTGKDT